MSIYSTKQEHYAIRRLNGTIGIVITYYSPLGCDAEQ